MVQVRGVGLKQSLISGEATGSQSDLIQEGRCALSVQLTALLESRERLRSDVADGQLEGGWPVRTVWVRGSRLEVVFVLWLRWRLLEVGEVVLLACEHRNNSYLATECTQTDRQRPLRVTNHGNPRH